MGEDRSQRLLPHKMDTENSKLVLFLHEKKLRTERIHDRFLQFLCVPSPPECKQGWQIIEQIIICIIWVASDKKFTSMTPINIKNYMMGTSPFCWDFMLLKPNKRF